MVELRQIAWHQWVIMKCLFNHSKVITYANMYAAAALLQYCNQLITILIGPAYS